MSIRITEKAKEGSTYIVNCKLRDDAGNLISDDAVVAVRWTLTDNAGNIINNRRHVVIASATSNEDIVLYGADLAVDEVGKKAYRRLLVEARYNSDLGNNLPLVEEGEFTVENATVYPVTTTTTTSTTTSTTTTTV